MKKMIFRILLACIFPLIIGVVALEAKDLEIRIKDTMRWTEWKQAKGPYRDRREGAKYNRAILEYKNDKGEEVKIEKNIELNPGEEIFLSLEGVDSTETLEEMRLTLKGNWVTEVKFLRWEEIIGASYTAKGKFTKVKNNDLFSILWDKIFSVEQWEKKVTG